MFILKTHSERLQDVFFQLMICGGSMQDVSMTRDFKSQIRFMKDLRILHIAHYFQALSKTFENTLQTYQIISLEIEMETFWRRVWSYVKDPLHLLLLS